MSGATVQVLLIGDHAACADLRGVVDVLREPDVFAGLRQTACIRDACSIERDENWIPTLIVVLQSWPDQFASDDVLKLLARFPLARLVCCTGGWCDSDGRTRDYWPAGCRAPIPIAPSRLLRELALIRQGLNANATAVQAGNRPTAGILPLTASRTECFAYDYSAAASRAQAELSVCVESPDRRFRAMLEAALRRAGHKVSHLGGDPPPELLVWDADPWDWVRAEALRQRHAASPGRAIVACAGFLRREHESQFLGCGAAGVWSKLAPLPMLYDLIAKASHSG